MKNSRLNLYCLLLIAIVVVPGCKSFHYRIAENYYEQYAYAKAIPKYEKVLRKEFIPDAAGKLAESYNKTGNTVKAEAWYKRLAANPQVTLQNKLDLAEVLMENGKYAEARDWFVQYLEFNSGDKRVKRMIQACDSIHLFFEDTTVYTISSLPVNIDTESNFSPAFYRDGIVFVSDRPAPGKNSSRSQTTGKEYFDLFYSRKTDGNNWTIPELLKGDINGRYHEGPAAFTDNFTTIYFTRNDYTGKNIETNQRDESNLKIYEGKLIGNLWQLKGPVSFNNPDYSVSYPTISKDGNRIYFVSDMPWGYGGKDIYVVTNQNGTWSEPQNLGSNINTEGNEMFPFIAEDSVLYFASDGHFGIGGLDIYSAYWDEDSWSTPENLQYPVNSSKDDFGFIIDSSNTNGYFSTNRVRDTDRLFAFHKNPPVFSLNVVAKDKKDKPIPAFLVSSISKTGQSKALASGKAGFAQSPLTRNTNYNLIISSPGYYSQKISLSTTGLRKSTTLEDTVLMEKIELNKAMILKSIDFNKKDFAISEKISKGLDSLVNILKLNPELQIEISSHTDSRGSFTENLNLSKKRADEITSYLVSKGISAPRIVSMGYGEAKLLNYCKDGILCLEEDHQVNNRIEIKVMGILK